MKIVVYVREDLLTKLLSVHVYRLFVLIVDLVAPNVSEFFFLKVLDYFVMKLLGHWAFSRFEVDIDEDYQYQDASVYGDHAGWAVAPVVKDEFGRIAKPASESGFYDVLFEVSVPAFDIKSSVKHLVLLNKFFELFSCLRFGIIVIKKWVENCEVNLENSIWIRNCAIVNSWNLLPCSVHKMSVKVV